MVTGICFDADTSEYKFAIARFNNDGTLDTATFPGTVSVKIGVSTQGSIAYSSRIQADGKIVLAGFNYNNGISEFAVARFIGDNVIVDNVEIDPTIVTAQITKDSLAIRLVEKYWPMLAPQLVATAV